MAAILSIGLPVHAATTCVNGALIDEFGITQGTCEGGSIDGNGAGANASDAFAFKRQGVFGCSQSGSYAMSVGSLSAVGGVYVPVNDAAVTLNTGYLVYKECVLRGVVNRQREAATAGIFKQGSTSFLRGRNGGPQFSQKIDREQKNEASRVVLSNLQNNLLATLNPSLKAPVTRAIARGYAQGLNAPGKVYECPYKGDLNAVYQVRSSETVWNSLRLVGNPACEPILAYALANEQVLGSASYSVDNMMRQLDWGDGTYPGETTDEFGDPVTVTPGQMLQSNYLQLLQTGYKQLENANDIDQMVNALFSGATSQVIGDNRGLAGLIQKTGSQPSYLDQVIRDAAQGLRDIAANAALQILSAAKQIEVGFRQAMETIAAVLSRTIADLRAKENACWTLIIPKVCATALAADNTCTSAQTCTGDADNPTCTPGDKLKVATTTAASQGVINARIAPLASSTIINLQRANESLVLVDRLIAGITNSASIEAQRVALQQLDNLVAQRKLHNQYDLQAAQQTSENISASMSTLAEDTVKAWADSPDPNIGWCNVNNAAVINLWKQRWKI